MTNALVFTNLVGIPGKSDYRQVHSLWFPIVPFSMNCAKRFGKVCT